MRTDRVPLGSVNRPAAANPLQKSRAGAVGGRLPRPPAATRVPAPGGGRPGPAGFVGAPPARDAAEEAGTTVAGNGGTGTEAGMDDAALTDAGSDPISDADVTPLPFGSGSRITRPCADGRKATVMTVTSSIVRAATAR